MDLPLRARVEKTIHGGKYIESPVNQKFLVQRPEKKVMLTLFRNMRSYKQCFLQPTSLDKIYLIYWINLVYKAILYISIYFQKINGRKIYILVWMKIYLFGWHVFRLKFCLHTRYSNWIYFRNKDEEKKYNDKKYVKRTSWKVVFMANFLDFIKNKLNTLYVGKILVETRAGKVNKFSPTPKYISFFSLSFQRENRIVLSITLNYIGWWGSCTGESRVLLYC